MTKSFSLFGRFVLVTWMPRSEWNELGIRDSWWFAFDASLPGAAYLCVLGLEFSVT